jgi:aminoglycoside/choline kinase family phosphotransferase
VDVLSIPTTADDLTDDWLTAVLRAGRVLDGARVAAHTAASVEQQGAAAVVTRIELEYDRSEPGAPRSLIVKSASPYAPIRALMNAMGGYRREVEFYRRFGDDAGIPVPHCFHADIDPATGEFVLVLEDMTDARLIRELPRDTDDAEIAVRHLAPFHAKWWNHPLLRELPFLRYPGNLEDQQFMTQARFALAAALPAARERWGSDVPETIIAVAEVLTNNFDALMERRRDAFGDAVTLVHGDFHPGQLFYPSERGGRFAVFDWQTVSAGNAGDDLARILTSGLTSEQRASHDARLIGLYHGLLVEHGVTGFDIDRCLESFRLGLLTTAIINIIASVNIDPALIDEYETTTETTLPEAMFGWIADALDAHGLPVAMTV